MDYLTLFSTLVMGNLQYVLLAMTVMILLALIIFININIRMAKMNRRYRKMMQGMEGVNIERLLLGHIDEVRQTVAKVEQLSAACSQMETVSKACVQKIGIVRFNAFEDTGSDLSYAIAMLDGKDNGVILSSIFGRSESRSYAKPVVDGQSTYFLTDEEKQALVLAMKKNNNS